MGAVPGRTRAGETASLKNPETIAERNPLLGQRRRPDLGDPQGNPADMIIPIEPYLELGAARTRGKRGLGKEGQRPFTRVEANAQYGSAFHVPEGQ